MIADADARRAHTVQGDRPERDERTRFEVQPVWKPNNHITRHEVHLGVRGNSLTRACNTLASGEPFGASTYVEHDAGGAVPKHRGLR